SLDVIEMDAASQRGIDDIREIRERVVLQPAEGRYKVYILDEAHQLTDAAWNALLKLIEEPPPHLVFVFCTTDLSKVLPTVRSRCQTFVFARPRLPELVRLLRRVADGEGIEVPDQALALVARSARGSFRDAVSTRDQLHAQVNQLGEATVIRLVDLLAVAVEDMRQGGDPRLPLDLALVKVTRPGADLSRESLAYRLDQLEQQRHVSAVATQPGEIPEAPSTEPPPSPPPSLELEQLQEAWQRTILPAVEERSIPAASVLREAHPAGLTEDTLTVEFPASAAFHRQLAEEPKNATLLEEALYEVTGRHLGLAFAEGEARPDNAEDDEPAGEE